MVKKITEEKEETLSFYPKKKKESFIKKRKKELTELCGELTEDKKLIVEPLIDELSFMFAEIKDLKEIIKRDGSTETYKNGRNQFGIKKSAASEVYNTMIKNYISTYKQFTDILPKNEAPKSDGFEEFING